MKFSNWFLNADEKFWSIVKDGLKRKDYLDELHRLRKISFIALCIYVIMWFFYMISSVDNVNVMGLFIFLFVTQGFTYIDADSKIKIIRLYELLSEK